MPVKRTCPVFACSRIQVSVYSSTVLYANDADRLKEAERRLMHAYQITEEAPERRASAVLFNIFFFILYYILPAAR